MIAIKQLLFNNNKIIMKKILYSLLSVMVFAACSTDYDTDEYFDLEELPAYVAFDADGNNAEQPATDVNEGESATVFVETPTKDFGTITATYTTSGTAVFGVDYTIPGASASGGSVTFSRSNDVTETIRGAITVVGLDDMTVDDDKTLVLTLTGATDASGTTIPIGRGGTDFLKSASFNLLNIHCPTTLEGEYDVAAAYSSHRLIDTTRTTTMSVKIDTIDGDIITTEVETIDLEIVPDSLMSTIELQKTGEFSYSVSDISGGLYASGGEYGMMFGTNGLAINFTDNCDAITISADQTDFSGQVISGSGSVSYNDDGDLSSISISLVGADNGEMWTATFTPK